MAKMGNHTFPQYSFNFGKSHSASSLSVVSNSALRNNDNNCMGSIDKNNADDTIQMNTIKSSSSSSSSSSTSSSSSSPNPPGQSLESESSSMKNTFKNVFSLKQKIPSENVSNLKTKHFESISSTVLIYDEESEEADIVLGDQKKQPKPQSNPNIFKKIISRKALIPRMKAFKRISDDLQIESYPLHDEIQHELIITTAMKDEDEILNSKSSYSLLLSRKNNQHQMLNYDNLKKFEIINKANESWNNNRRKSSSSLTNSESFRSYSNHGSTSNLNFNVNNRRASINSLTPTNTNTTASTTTIPTRLTSDNKASTTGSGKNKSITKGKNISATSLANPLTPLRSSRKRKLYNEDEFSTDIEDYLSDDGGVSSWNPTTNSKRRLVSASVTNSPKSPALDPFPSRRNSIMMHSVQSTFDDFELMSLK